MVIYRYSTITRCGHSTNIIIGITSCTYNWSISNASNHFAINTASRCSNSYMTISIHSYSANGTHTTRIFLKKETFKINCKLASIYKKKFTSGPISVFAMPPFFFHFSNASKATGVINVPGGKIGTFWKNSIFNLCFT